MNIISVLLLVSGAIAANIRGSENVGSRNIPVDRQESSNAIIRNEGLNNLQPPTGAYLIQYYQQMPSGFQPGSIDEAFWQGIHGDKEISTEYSLYTPPMFAFFYPGAKKPDKYEFQDAAQILKNSNFDSQKKTVIYIHGFLEGLFVESVQHITRAYLKRGDFNVIILDWHTQALPPYFPHAVPQVPVVGKMAAGAILDMINSGLSLDKLHVVGHSLGGQMAGIIGRQIQRLSRGSIILKRIFALDPAFPGFYGIAGKEPLNEDDAERVIVVHTDAGFYGAPGTTGTVDFWANGGIHPQPGCPDLANNICSHQRSWWYWSESLGGKKYNGVGSLDWDSFKRGICDPLNANATMGIDTPDNLYGSYYFQTNQDPIYARGVLGATYRDEFDSKVQSSRKAATVNQ